MLVIRPRQLLLHFLQLHHLHPHIHKEHAEVGQEALTEGVGAERVVLEPELVERTLQRLLRQYLYFCTSKASKLNAKLVSARSIDKPRA